MDYLLKYDIFLFDFDGTILDTEKYHCLAWNLAISELINKNINLNLQEYQKNFHNINKNNSKYFLKIMYDIDNYECVYKLKQKKYKELTESENFELIEGVENLLNFIIKNNKKFIIVTNTAEINIINFSKKFEILNKADSIFSKEIFFNKKPNPECYLKFIDLYPNSKIIGFEDSLPGFHALYQVNKITPVLINDDNYYFKECIKKNYNNYIISNKYDLNELNNNLIHFHDNHNIEYKYIDKILNNNILELQKNFENMRNIINQISIIIKNNSSNIFLSGMGKSGYVCKKCASTWQSLSIKCSYIDLPNLPHGDFGIFNENDILILISNGGNTDEIIKILEYIKIHFKINIISIVANKYNLMEKYSNYTFYLENINESDSINMAPSTSSLIFMSLLDGIGINIKKNLTKEEFQLVHPGGNLGKK